MLWLVVSRAEAEAMDVLTMWASALDHSYRKKPRYRPNATSKKATSVNAALPQ